MFVPRRGLIKLGQNIDLSPTMSFFKVGDKSLINSEIGLHEVPAKLNFEGETSEVLLSSQAHFVMCLG